MCRSALLPALLVFIPGSSAFRYSSCSQSCERRLLEVLHRISRQIAYQARCVLQYQVTLCLPPWFLSTDEPPYWSLTLRFLLSCRGWHVLFGLLQLRILLRY